MRRRVAVIVGNYLVLSAIKAATTTIPIVFVTGTDPVRAGLVKSLNKPGANVTGIAFFLGPLIAKRLQLLHELTPKSAAIAVLLDPNWAKLAFEEREAKETARALGRDILVAKLAPRLTSRRFSDDCPCAPRRAASGGRRFSRPQPAPAA